MGVWFVVESEMKPYYEDKGITIYHGDCLVGVSALGDASIDCVVTDPPFKISQTYTANVDADNLIAVSAIWPASHEVFRVVKDGAYFAMFYDTRILPLAIDAMRWSGWKYLRGLTFYRRWGAANKLYGWMSTSDFILLFRKPSDVPFAFYSDDWRHDVYIKAGPEAEGFDHAAQKPLDDVTHLVRHLCPADGVVLDPFMGTGTTLRAARLLGMKAVGIDIDERSCEIAAERLSRVFPLAPLSQEVLNFENVA